MRVVILRGRVSLGHFVRVSVDILRDVVRITCIFFFSILDSCVLVHGSCDHF